MFTFWLLILVHQLFVVEVNSLLHYDKFRSRLPTRHLRRSGTPTLPTLYSSTTDGVTANHHDSAENVLSWLTKQPNSQFCNRVRIGENAEGIRGLLVTENVDAGETLLSVPMEVCLKNNQAPAWAASLPKKVQLAILLLQLTKEITDDDENSDHKNNALFQPFLDSWPTEIPGLLEFIPEEELRKEAQCQTLIRDVQNHKQYVQEQYSKISQLIPSSWSSKVSLSDFQQTLALVGSRCIAVSPRESLLVPVLDMANHAFKPSSHYRLLQDEDGNGGKRDSVILVAAHPLRSGDEITISYGSHCNRVFAGCYGFVPFDNNPCDYELVSLIEILQAAKDEGVALDGRTADIFEMEREVADLGFLTTNLKMQASEGPEEALLSALRVAFGTDEFRQELSELLEAIEDDEADEEDLDYLWENEDAKVSMERVKVLQAACTVFEKRIGGSETTLDEDQTRLVEGNGNGLTPGGRLLLQLRIARKALFRNISRGLHK